MTLSSAALKPVLLLGVAIAVIGNALFAFSQLQPDASIPARLLREATIWGLLAVVLFYALRVSEQRIADDDDGDAEEEDGFRVNDGAHKSSPERRGSS